MTHACHMCSILFLPVQSLLMHVFQKLSYLLCRLCLSLSSLTLLQTVRLFNVSFIVGIHVPSCKDSHKSLSSTEKPQYCVLQVTWSYITVTYVLRRGIRKHCTWRKWLTYRSHGKFITVLTFELSSFRENGFLCIFHAVAADTSRSTPKSARRQNTENGHTDTQTACAEG